jgi:hypothetical protein
MRGFTPEQSGPELWRLERGRRSLNGLIFRSCRSEHRDAMYVARKPGLIDRRLPNVSGPTSHGQTQRCAEDPRRHKLHRRWSQTPLQFIKSRIS